MGIKGLAKLLSDEAPDCIREVPLSTLHGRKIAMDASMAIYQFLIAVRSGNQNNPAAMLTNAEGETTSHIQGLFNRTIRFLTEGIRPVYVFDGKPPSIKSGELMKRREKRIKAQEALKQAQEEGNVEEQDKHSKRLVRAGQKENEDCQKLLKLMGIPVIVAPCEAEAQAATMASLGQVYAAGTEDMDALTFQTPVLVRKMTFANASKSTVQTINYKKAIEGLELSHEEFVDLCILLGCDYCDTIRGVGPKTALRLIREHKNIETILKNLDPQKYGIPEDWLSASAKKEEDYNTDDENEDSKNKGDDDDEETVPPAYVQARRLFMKHETTKDAKFKWEPCQVDALTKFLVDDQGFNPDRVKANIEKLQKAFAATSKPQTRMDSFFSVKPAAKKVTPPDSKKRKGTAASKSSKAFAKRKR